MGILDAHKFTFIRCCKYFFDLSTGVGRPVVFGFFQLDNEVVEKAEEVLEELKRNLTDKMLADLPLLHGGPLFMFQPLKL